MNRGNAAELAGGPALAGNVISGLDSGVSADLPSKGSNDITGYGIRCLLPAPLKPEWGVSGTGLAGLEFNYGAEEKMNTALKIMVGGMLVLATQMSFARDDAHRVSKCRLAHLNGEWVGFQAEVLKNPHTGVCDFTVKDGAVNGKCDFTLPNATGLAFAGNVTVKPDCSAELTMDFAPAPFVSTFHLQLNRDKRSYVGRWENTFGAIGPTNGVKKP